MMITQMDAILFLTIAGAGRSSDLGVALFSGATLVGDAAVRLVIAAGVLAALLVERRRRAALFLLTAVLGGWALSTILKLIVARPRPDLIPALDHVSTYSFPSGHAWNGMVVFGAIALVAPPGARRWALAGAGLLILMIGLSRVVLGVHWPSDVVAGWIGGAAWLAVCRRLFAVGGAAPDRR